MVSLGGLLSEKMVDANTNEEKEGEEAFFVF